MKPTIDLSNPAVQQAIASLNADANATRFAVRRFEGAVRPGFTFDPNKPGGKKVPEQVGSCVLLSLDGELFLLSAAHVFEHHAQWPILVGWENRLVRLRGQRYSSVPGHTGRHDSDRVMPRHFM
ncbi:MAG TPA: hypothetical protein VHO25_02750 [Polyangiaceae bacterium]|nr:hypothetical protein [Polyangiaceae bacterium]